VVEDDSFVRAHATLSLGSLGYKVVTAEDGAKGLKLLRENPDIDLVFTDIVMPGTMSGWQLAEAIKVEWPDLPVLFTSGYAQESVTRYSQIDAPIQQALPQTPAGETDTRDAGSGRQQGRGVHSCPGWFVAVGFSQAATLPPRPCRGPTG